DPDDLAGGAERIELLGPVAGNPPRQEIVLPQRHRETEALERDERLAKRRAAVHPVPAREETAESSLLGRLNLTPERGERSPAQAAEHLGVAPLSLGPAWPQLPAHELVLS